MEQVIYQLLKQILYGCLRGKYNPGFVVLNSKNVYS